MGTAQASYTTRGRRSAWGRVVGGRAAGELRHCYSLVGDQDGTGRWNRGDYGGEWPYSWSLPPDSLGSCLLLLHVLASIKRESGLIPLPHAGELGYVVSSQSTKAAMYQRRTM